MNNKDAAAYFASQPPDKPAEILVTLKDLTSFTSVNPTLLDEETADAVGLPDTAIGILTVDV